MKTVIAIGGGDLRERETLKIDGYIAELAKRRAGEKRANALFIPTASHDYMPYYNTFHKVYTGVYNIKTDVALTVFKQVDVEKMQQKFLNADVIYVGGGDTLFMMDSWKNSGLLPLIEDAYQRGVIISGLSAGAICWFNKIFCDVSATDPKSKYAFKSGLGWFNGTISPHYNVRTEEFDASFKGELGYGVEDNAALVIHDGEVVGSITCGGSAYKITQAQGRAVKQKILKIEKL